MPISYPVICPVNRIVLHGWIAQKARKTLKKKKRAAKCRQKAAVAAI